MSDSPKDEDKEDVISSVRSRPLSTRSLTRRHSLSLPPGRKDFDREIDVGVLQTVQLHLHARHTFTSAVESQQKEIDVPPRLSEDDSRQSPFVIAVKEAVARKDTARLIRFVRWLVDPSTSVEFSSLYPKLTLRDFNALLHALASLYPTQNPALLNDTYGALLAQGLAPNLWTYMHMILGLTARDCEVQRILRDLEMSERHSNFAGHTSESAQRAMKQKEALAAEDNFHTAILLFKAALTSLSFKKRRSVQSVVMTPRLPVSIYHALLRSCAHHASIENAIFVYSHLENQLSLTSHLPVYPSTTPFYHLITAYVNASDLGGAKEIFSEFKRLCSRGQVATSDASRQVGVWNKMLEAYFNAGQPATALRLLELMMDGGSVGKDDHKGIIYECFLDLF